MDSDDLIQMPMQSKHTQSHPPLNRSPPPLQTSGAMAVPSWGWRIFARIFFARSTTCCLLRIVATPKVLWSSKSRWAVNASNSDTIYSRRHRHADLNLLRHCIPALCSSWTLRCPIPMQHDPAWVNQDRRPGPLTSTSPSWHATARRLCYWASSAILVW